LTKTMNQKANQYLLS